MVGVRRTRYRYCEAAARALGESRQPGFAIREHFPDAHDFVDDPATASVLFTAETRIGPIPRPYFEKVVNLPRIDGQQEERPYPWLAKLPPGFFGKPN